MVHPPGYISERAYVYEVMLGEFLGVEYVTEVADRQDVRLTLEGDASGREVILSDAFFQTPPSEWLQAGALPRQPLARWNAHADGVAATLVEPEVPVLYGEPLGDGNFVKRDGDSLRLGIDLLGGAFFMLSRYEEVVVQERDARGRFPAHASVAVQEGFLQRPLVNEYLEILWWALQHLAPGLGRKPRSFQMLLSHDVDWPLSTSGCDARQLLKRVVGDVVKRKDWQLAKMRVRAYQEVRRGNVEADFFHTFDQIMTESERQGIKSAFYFITAHTAGEIDGVYEMHEPWIRSLLREIAARGHEIGLHPSYNTFRDPVQIKREYDILRTTCAEESITQAAWGGRQHYLRWEAPTTWQAWEDAGLAYDSTLSYAERPGFRSGVCYEHPVFNLHTRQMLRLRERPLVVMEQSVLHTDYMHLDAEAAWREIDLLRERCRLFAGDFTMLWHNSQLVKEAEVELYRRIVRS